MKMEVVATKQEITEFLNHIISVERAAFHQYLRSPSIYPKYEASDAVQKVFGQLSKAAGWKAKE